MLRDCTRMLCAGAALVAAAAAPLLMSPAPARAADHRDSPSMIVDPAADLLDVYVFVNPNDTTKVVLALTVNPAQVPGLPNVGFSPDVLYQFKIDTDGDFDEDLVVQARFTPPGPDQQVTITGPAAPSKTGATNKLITNKKAPTFTVAANGTTQAGNAASSPVTRAWAGLADDPFFFDLLRISRLIGIAAARENDRAPGIDFYDTLNVSALVIELPATALNAGTDNKVNVWATTSRSASTRRSAKAQAEKANASFVQIERTAIPSLNTVFIPRARKEEFNRSVPKDDLSKFREQFLSTLVRLNNVSAPTPEMQNLVDTTLLPDVLRFDVTSTGGFPNGRRFQDDVIDTALQLVTFNPAASDNVAANDVPFQADFPFIAPANSPTQPIPARD